MIFTSIAILAFLLLLFLCLVSDKLNRILFALIRIDDSSSLLLFFFFFIDRSFCILLLEFTCRDQIDFVGQSMSISKCLLAQVWEIPEHPVVLRRKQMSLLAKLTFLLVVQSVYIGKEEKSRRKEREREKETQCSLKKTLNSQ